MEENQFSRKYNTFTKPDAENHERPINSTRNSMVEDIICDARIQFPGRVKHEFKTSAEPPFRASPLLSKRPQLKPDVEQPITQKSEQPEVRVHGCYARDEARKTHFEFYDNVQQNDYQRSEEEFFEEKFEVFVPKPAKAKKVETVELQNRQEERFIEGTASEHVKKTLKLQPAEDVVGIYESHANVVEPHLCDEDFTRKLGGQTKVKLIQCTPVKSDRICLKQLRDEKQRREILSRSTVLSDVK